MSVEEINWGIAGDKPRSASFTYDEYFDQTVKKDRDLNLGRKRFYEALRLDDAKVAEEGWNSVADKVGGQKWQDLGEVHDTLRAFGVLATIRRGQIAVKTRLTISELPELVNSMLLEPTNRRHWTPAFEFIAKAEPSLLAVPTVEQKRARNTSELPLDQKADQKAGQVFNVFFPEGAFARLRE